MGTDNKFKVLIVDDEPEILDIVGDEFRDAGMDAEVAKSSVDAIKKIGSLIKSKISIKLLHITRS